MLRKFNARVEDATGSAVASPSVSVLRVGAEIVRDASFGEAIVAVRHPGALRQNDVCNVIRAGSILSGVTVTIADPTWVYDAANGDWTSEIATTGGYTIVPGDRLVLTGNTSGHFVKVYDNDLGAGTPVTAAFTAAASGVIEKYVDATDVDIKIVSGSTTAYITDIATDRRADVDGDITIQTTSATVAWQHDFSTEWVRFGRAARLVAWGRCTGTAGSKTIRLLLNSSALTAVVVLTTNDWRIEALVTAAKTGGQQRYSVKGYDGTAEEGFDVAGTLTEAEPLSLKLDAAVVDTADSVIVDGVVFELLGG